MPELADEKDFLKWTIVYPQKATPGSFGVAVEASRLEEMRALEIQPSERVWEVRGVPSDHIPLAGLGALTGQARHEVRLHEDRMVIHLHRGGKKVHFFELVAKGADRHLDYISVWVRTKLPSNALLFAREPLSRLLDRLAITLNQPLVYQRLDLVSPSDSSVLASELLTPTNPNGVIFGPLGGFGQHDLFAPYDSICREAATNTSPFYRLLCACRIYEGLRDLRRRIKVLATKVGVNEPMPSDPAVDPIDLGKMGLTDSRFSSVRKLNDFFSLISEERNAVAHFLLEGKDEPPSHAFMADGVVFLQYSLVSGAFLAYTTAALRDLSLFFNRHLGPIVNRGSILPLVDKARDWPVDGPDGAEEPKADSVR